MILPLLWEGWRAFYLTQKCFVVCEIGRFL